MSSADDSKRMRLKGPWRNDDGRAHHVRRKIRRFILSAVLSLGLFVFGLWLTEPFQTPQTHILSAFATFDPQQTYGTRFTPTDEHAWQELSRIHNTNETSPFLLTLENLQRHVAQVAERCSLRDRVVLNISSHGIAIDGEAYLLADEFQPAFEDTLLISVRDILIALRDIPCETKLIAIDGGSILCDDRLGAAVNDYPSCLANVVSEMADASMCVLTSHGDGELSELSYRLGQSVFAHFVQRALFGEADADRNRIVDFQELHRFVAESTRAFVATESGGQTSQNPMLLRGDAFREANVALPVSSIAKPPSKLLERELAWTARFSAAKSGSAVVPPDKKGPPSAENASHGDREILSPIVSESQQLAQLVAQAWVLRDALRKDERVADVPHLFRAFEESLVGCEQACRIGTLDQIRAARQHLKAELFYWQQPVTSANSIQPLPEGAYTLRNVAEPADNEPIAKKFADLVAALKTKDFQKWVNSNWNDDLDRLYEARIVPQLLAAGIDDGEVVSQVVRLRRLAVKAGDDRPSARDLQNADSLRLAAEQLLIQKSSVDWERKAAEALSVAQDEYNAAISHADRRQYAEHARAMATINAGRLFRWFTLVRGQASIWCPSLSQLLDYVDNVTQLSDELASDDSETAARLVRDLARSDQRIASMLVDDAQRLLGKAGSVTEGRTLLIEKLLATSLPSAGLRAQLLNELEQNYRSKDLPLPHDEFASMQDNVQQDALSLLQIQLRLARLSSLPNTELRRRIDKAIKSLDSNDSSQSVADASTELKRIHYSIREQIPVLSTKLTALSSDECSTATLRLTRILETIDHRDAPTFSDISLQPTHARLAEFRQLQQRESRFRYFRDYAFQDIAYLTAASQQFKSRSNQLFPHSDDEATASVVQIAAPDEISLAESSEQRFDVGVDTEKDVPVWLVAEYDTSMVSVESAEDHPVYDSGQLQLQNVDRYAALKTLPVTAQSKAQGSTTLPLTIRHKSTSQASTQITLTAVTPQEVIRKSLQVELPGSGTLAVVADGERGTWVEQDTHVILQPLPNRTQTYDLGIRNRGKDTETVDVSVFALPAAIAMPKGALAIADASSHLVNLQQNLIASLHDLELRPAAVTKIPFPKLAPPKKGEATELHQNIEHGLVVAISNRATDRVSFHRIAIAPQRPRRYVEPRVTFDARLRRLRV
ncbi:MAG: hypothetical protein KDB27_12320 [Planctomycetales bacterium]|nr:hypothetical protein [Planctomycetales bacterium]